MGSAHRELSENHRRSFLDRPEIAELAGMPKQAVERAIRLNCQDHL